MTDLIGGRLPLALEVYRSSRHELMYVYLLAQPEQDAPSADLSLLPEVLLERFGRPVYAFSFELTQGRKLAAADADQVRAAVAERGFYLQMPPTLSTTETPDAVNPHEGRT